MTNTNPLLAQAQASENDQTETTVFENDVSPAGPTFARFVGYVETGVRPQKAYKGAAKADCHEVRFTFELNGPKHCRTIEVDGEEKHITNVIGIKLTKKTAENSGFIKLFNKMRYGRPDIKNFPQMLNEGFLINIIHADGVDKDGKKVTYANMKDAEFNYLIGAPSQINPATGQTVNFAIPEATIPLRLLLWDKPTKAQWDSIFIEGTRTVKVNGKDVEESKNWLQTDIVTCAVNYLGSPLEHFLAGADDLELPGDGGKTATPENTEMPLELPTEIPDASEASKPKDDINLPHSEPQATPPVDDAAQAAQALFDQLGVGK